MYNEYNHCWEVYMTNPPSIFERVANINMKVLCEHEQIQLLTFNFQIEEMKKDIIGYASTHFDVESEVKKRTIKINSIYVEDFKKLILAEVIPHEVCHLVQHRIENSGGHKHHSHGKLWARLMNRMGFMKPRETIDIERLYELSKTK